MTAVADAERSAGSWSLSPHVVAFCAELRTAGVSIGAGETQDALRALAVVDAGRPARFRHALRQTLAKSREAQAIFDRQFDRFWRARLREPAAADTDDDPAAPEEKAYPLDPAGTAPARPAAGEPAKRCESETGTGASSQARLAGRDFATVSQAEIAEMRSLIELIGRRLAARVGRRWRAAATAEPDLRRSMRAALSRGGELIEIRRRRRRRQKLRLVVLADVSHSMDAYSRFFLTFIFAFQDLFSTIETFVFSTRLSRVTGALRRGTLDQALDALPEAVEDWAGGTRIGDSLTTFLHEHGDRLLGRDTIVIVVSDGWDTGEERRFDAAMRRIANASRRVLWLDPLFEHPRYFATARGVHRDNPHVDWVLPARDLASLRRLAGRLERVIAA